MISVELFATLIAAGAFAAAAVLTRYWYDQGVKIPGIRRKPEPVDIHKVKPGKVIYAPKPGFEPNPFLGYPRNSKCFCGSGKKFKYCCKKRQPRLLVNEKAAIARSYLADAAEYKRRGEQGLPQ